MRKALVVEDDAETRHCLVEILEGDGCVVDSVDNGERAAGLLAHEDYEVVLLDLGLPRASGTDVMEHIACTRPQTLARTIIVTGSDTASVRALFPEVCDALAKPIIPAELLQAVRRCGTPASPSMPRVSARRYLRAH